MEADLKAITEATAGAVGGALSTTILYPLDTCKTKFQAEARADGSNKYRSLLDVLREAVACGKASSLYQGLATKNCHAILSGFVYFYSYSYIKSKYLEHKGVSKMGTLANLAVAAAAGACTACATQPLDTLSARMQTSKPGEAKSFLTLLKEGGIQHAFDGLGISLVLTVNPAIQYTVFEQLKTRVLERQQARQALSSGCPDPPVALSAFMAFALGAVSKCVATVLTYPLIRCKVIMQRAATPEEEELRRLAGGDAKAAGPPTNMIRAFQIIWHSEGIPGLYKGLEAQMLKTVLSAALMLMIKEKVSEGSRSAVLALHRLVTARKAQPSAPALPQSVGKTTGPSGLPLVTGPQGKVGSSIQPSVRMIPLRFNGHAADRVGDSHTAHLIATDEGTV